MEDKSNHQNKFAPDTTQVFHVQDATITMLCFLSLCPGHCYYNICSTLKWAVTTIHYLTLTVFSTTVPKTWTVIAKHHNIVVYQLCSTF